MLAKDKALCYTSYGMKTIDKQRALSLLENLYPDAKPALHYTTSYELLVAVILSAQTRSSKRENIPLLRGFIN